MQGGRTLCTGQTVCSLYSSTSNKSPFRADPMRESQSRHRGRISLSRRDSPDRQAAFPRAGKVALVPESLAVCIRPVVVVVVVLEVVPRCRGMWVVEVVTAEARPERSRAPRTAAAGCSFLDSQSEPVSFECMRKSQGLYGLTTRERRERRTKLAPFQNGKLGGGRLGCGGGDHDDDDDCPVYCESSLRGGGGGRDGAT